MFLIDTNVFSELVKPRPNEAVCDRLLGAAEGSLFASEMTRYELRFGALILHNPAPLWARIQALVLPIAQWLAVTTAISDRAARVAAELRRKGRPSDLVDPFIAATALEMGCPVVTRNVRHFDGVDGLTVLDWFAAND